MIYLTFCWKAALTESIFAGKYRKADNTNNKSKHWNTENQKLNEYIFLNDYFSLN